MKNTKLISIIIIIKIFQSIFNEEIKEANLDDNQGKIDKFIFEYRKNFSKINTTVLTDENQIDYVQNHSFTLLYFHSAYDKHCIDFMPTFKFINDYLNTQTISDDSLYIVNLATIDFSDDENNSEIQHRFRLTTFPFFIIFSSIYQKYIRYTGYLNAPSVITFSMKAILDNIIEIRDEKRLNQLLNPQLTHLSVFCMSTRFNFDDFYRASQLFTYGLFVDCIGKTVCKNYFTKPEYKSSDIIIAKMNLCKNDFICGDIQIMDKIAKPYFILYNHTTYEDLIELISLNIIPPIHNMTDFNFDLMMKNTLKTIIYIRGQNEKKTNQEISLILQKILKKRKNGIKWGSILDPINSQNDYEIRRQLSIEEEDYLEKGLLLIHTSNDISKEKETYRMNMKDININELNEDITIKFVNDFNSRKIKRDIKSELKPKHHPKKNLRMVVGKTFKNDILNNFNKSIVLILLNLNMENLHMIEDQIESMCIKFGLYNQTIIFNFLDSYLNEMPDMPKYDIFKRPFYRYYYKNKTKGYVDFKGKNIFDQNEIEEWIIDNYAKEYGIEHKYGMRMHIDGMSELLKDKNVMKQIEKQQKIEQLQEELGIKDDDKEDNNNKNENDNNDDKNQKKETDL